jgi:hypothetical protein
LSPNYSVPWEVLQRRLFHFLLNDNISVKTWPEKKEVEIKGKGRVIGSIENVVRGFDGCQDITVVLSVNEQDSPYWSSKRKGVRHLQATANDVWKGDIVYLLEGTSRSMIIRRFGVVFYIIALAAPSTDEHRNELFPRQITLLWVWAKLPEDSKNHSSSVSVEAKSYWNAALALTDVKATYKASVLITRLIEMLSTMKIQRNPGAGHSAFGMQEITQMEVLDLVRHLDSPVFTRLLPWIPPDIRTTERLIIETVKWLDKKSVDQVLLERKEDRTVVTEAVILAAISNKSSHRGETHLQEEKEKLQLLLDYNSDKTFFTENTLVAAASKLGCRRDTMQLLLSYKNDNALITEAVLIAAAGTRNDTLPLLLDCKGAKADISEAVLVAAAGAGTGYHDHSRCNFSILLERYASKIEITEAVLVAAVGNSCQVGKHLEAILNLKKDNKLRATETVLCAAAGNPFTGLLVLRILCAKLGEEEVEFPDGVTQSVLQAAAGNSGYDGVEIMELLLDLIEGDIHVTAPVIEAARTNKWQSHSLVRLLCDRSDEAWQIYVSMGRT